MKELEDIIQNGKKFLKDGEFSKAVETFEKGLELIKGNKKDNSQNISLLLLLGDAYFGSKDYESALKNFKAGKRKIQKKEEINLVNFKIGQCYFEKGDEKKALKEFKNVYVYSGLEYFKKANKKYLEVLEQKVLQNPNKDKKLVDDFLNIIHFGDLETLKRVFDICRIDATYNGYNAFYYTMSIEKLKFFVEKGLDPNEDCGAGYPAIVYQCYKDAIDLLKQYNADLDLAMKYSKETDNLNNISNLMDCGVELGDYNFPVEYWLEYGSNTDIVNIYRFSKLEIEKGLKITQKMKDAVTKIGERFEFYRDDFNKDSVEEYSAALEGLYKLFDVTPVPRRKSNSLDKKIEVKSETWQEQFGELWDSLVPGNGPAISVQGELIRISGKISHELLDNGGINWDEDYQKMLESIEKYVSEGVDKNNKEIIEICKKINVNTDEETLLLFTKLVVEWVLANPNQIKLEEED